jgi:hypothetical protein
MNRYQVSQRKVIPLRKPSPKPKRFVLVPSYEYIKAKIKKEQDEKIKRYRRSVLFKYSDWNTLDETKKEDEKIEEVEKKEEKMEPVKEFEEKIDKDMKEWGNEDFAKFWEYYGEWLNSPSLL